jgi:hypothetical protein
MIYISRLESEYVQTRNVIFALCVQEATKRTETALKVSVCMLNVISAIPCTQISTVIKATLKIMLLIATYVLPTQLADA